jgi:hypothetical protein
MKTEFVNTRELIENWPGLEPELRDALLSVISTRGKWKGYLLANSPSPSKEPARNAAWQAALGELAPVRTSVWALMIMDEETRAFYNRLEAALQGNLGFALRVYEPPFRWNLFAHRVDIDVARQGVFDYCQKQKGVA